MAARPKYDPLNNTLTNSTVEAGRRPNDKWPFSVLLFAIGFGLHFCKYFARKKAMNLFNEKGKL